MTIGKQFLSGPEFYASPQKKRKWLIEPLIPYSGIVNLYGKPKTGKSFASMGMGLAIATPGTLHWNGFPVRSHGPVMYLQIDTPEGEMHDRIGSLIHAGYDTSRLFFADIDIAPYPYNILTPQHQTWLKTEIERIQPLLVVIDTLREAHEKDENNSTDMKIVINALVSISRPSAVALISHSRKDSVYSAMGAEQDIMDEGRGTSYVPGRMDTVFKFTGNPGKTHGYMTYKGRSKGADGKLKVVQEPDTGLVVRDADEAKQEQLILHMFAQHGTEWSVNKMADALVADSNFALSKKTAQRRLSELKESKTHVGRIPTESEVPVHSEEAWSNPSKGDDQSLENKQLE